VIFDLRFYWFLGFGSWIFLIKLTTHHSPLTIIILAGLIVRLMSQDMIIAPDKAQPLGRYPHTRRIGPWVFISGTSSRRPDNSYAGAEQQASGQWDLDIKIQTKAVLENIKHYLQLNGGDLQHLVDVTVFLKDMKHFDEYNEVYNSFFSSTGPCRTTVAAADLPKPQILIEIKGTAYIDNE
jgi:2-aminomuconate deaminase